MTFDVHSRTELNYRDRVLPCYVVSYIKEGSCRVRFEGKDYAAGPGDVIFLPPFIPHDHVKDTNENTVFMWWHFNYRIAGAMDVFRLFHLPVCFPLSNAERLEAIFSQYIGYAGKPGSIADLIMKEAKALELIAILLEAVVTTSGIRPTDRVSEAFSEILTDMVRHPERHYTLNELGEKYHMHPTYITNQFKKIFQLTPKQLQSKIRVDKAQKMLLADRTGIAQIGYSLGYADIDDFTRFFKNQVGVSPLAYRKAKQP
nr:AraC family transcriptional regulator [Paenibacillus sacheonensis]